MYYTVQEQMGCRVVTGPIPITDFVALTSAWSHDHPADDLPPEEQWIVDADLSQRLHATMVCGPRHAVDALRAHLDRVQHGIETP